MNRNYIRGPLVATALALGGCGTTAGYTNLHEANNLSSNIRISDAADHYSRGTGLMRAAETERTVDCIKNLEGRIFDNQANAFAGIDNCVSIERKNDLLVYGGAGIAIDIAKLIALAYSAHSVFAGEKAATTATPPTPPAPTPAPSGGITGFGGGLIK